MRKITEVVLEKKETLPAGDIGTWGSDNLEQKMICPYTPFIPIRYLINWREMRGADSTNRMIGDTSRRAIRLKCENSSPEANYIEVLAKLEKLLRRTEPLYTFAYDALSARSWGNECKQQLYNQINLYLSSSHYCTPYNLSGVSYINNSTEEMGKRFSRPEISQFGLRTYKGLIGNYQFSHMIEREGRDTIHEDYILPVILPQNLVYQKLHILLTGTIDLSKVIILISKELEDPNFFLSGMRTLYLGRLKAQLKATSAQLFFVPTDYIKNNCYIPEKPVLQSRKLAHRKQETESIAEIFKEYLINNRVDMNRLFRPPVEAVPVEPALPVVLVPEVDSTSLLSDRFGELGVAPETVSIPIVESMQARVDLVNTLREEMMTALGTREPVNNDY